MKLLVLGANGQVGWELQRSLAPLGEVVALGREELDLEAPEGIQPAIDRLAPDFILNATAYTAVDKAESEPERAAAVNVAAPAVMAKIAADRGIWLVQYSTDYVFDGTKSGAYVETDATNPQSVYGRTKRDGEDAIRAAGGRHLIFRTSWVHAARGGNFIKTVLRLAREREALSMVADQIGAPTGAELIADVTAQAVQAILSGVVDAEAASGTYHLAAAGETDWHRYAQLIVREARRRGYELRLEAEAIRPITTAEYPLPAARPANSRLDTTRLRQTFGLVLPDWQRGVERTVAELVEAGR